MYARIQKEIDYLERIKPSHIKEALALHYFLADRKLLTGNTSAAQKHLSSAEELYAGIYVAKQHGYIHSESEAANWKRRLDNLSQKVDERLKSEQTIQSAFEFIVQTTP